MSRSTLDASDAAGGRRPTLPLGVDPESFLNETLPPPTPMPDGLAITALRSRVNKNGRGAIRIDVELDGEPWATLDAETVMAERLKRGTTLGEQRRREVLLADETLLARRAAATRAAFRPRSAVELRRHLKGRKFSETAIEQALAQLQASGTIDDEKVAARWLRKRSRQGGYGEARLRSELHGLGIGGAIIDRQLDLWRAESNPAEECRTLARKKWAAVRDQSDPKARERLRRLLARRGFDAEVVAATLKSILAGDEGSGDE